MKTEAVYFVSPGQAEVREVEIPDTRPDQVQVRCLANGICMGEVSIFNGIEVSRFPLPRIVGHEGIGVVTKVGREVEHLREGDIVTCSLWARDWNYSASSLSRFSYLPADPAVFLAEPVACVVSALYAYDITPGDRVLLMGAGYMGLLNVQGLARYPLAELIVTDLKPRNLELAATFGATEVLQIGTPEAEKRLRELEDEPFDLVVEASGAAEALALCSTLTRIGGRIGIFSWHHTPRTVDLGTWHIRGLKVLNAGPNISTDRNVSQMARAVRLMERGLFDQRPLITHRHPVARVQEAMELAASRPADYIKGVLLFD